MTGVKKPTPAEICERIKKLGYSVGRRIHLYGERMKVLSDPFVQHGLIAVRVRARAGSERAVYLPTAVLQRVR